MERNKIHQITSIAITSYEDEDVSTAVQEERTEGLLSYKQASFPGNFKKNLRHRYCSQKQVDAGSSQSNSPSEEVSLKDLPRHSPTSLKSLEIESTSKKTEDDSDVIIESARGSPDFTQMSFIQQEHSPTKKYGLEFLHKKELVNDPFGHPSHKYFRSEMTTRPQEQNIHKSQNTTQQLLHQHSPGFPSPLFMSSANSSPFRPVPEASNIFSFDMPFESLDLDRKVSSAYPGMSPGINFSFPPSAIMHNPMSQMNQLAVSSRGMYPSQSFDMHLSKIRRQAVLEQNHHQLRTLSDSDAYSCPVCNQVFFSYHSLAKHMAKHLATETVPHGDNNNKGHYCSVCNRAVINSPPKVVFMRLYFKYCIAGNVCCLQVMSFS
ncbi:unnamed protein product [Mytilus coruscus]|uniref:C2H2-type domain-containing protein n=1 Tax=Mytilus coruscus TaxID=42192 RepID=A0A6J8ADC9_MYTCO|nr:unnamed protein product [Mytilus coruscus]